MSANGISTLTTNGFADKEKRQKAKLALAEADRAARNVVEPGRYADVTADIDQLPTKYVGDTVFDNDNTGGLKPGRPWAT